MMALELERAKKQRYIALIMAFKTIDAFAIPTLSPDAMQKYADVKAELIYSYGKGVENINELQLGN